MGLKDMAKKLGISESVLIDNRPIGFTLLDKIFDAPQADDKNFRVYMEIGFGSDSTPRQKNSFVAYELDIAEENLNLIYNMMLNVAFSSRSDYHRPLYKMQDEHPFDIIPRTDHNIEIYSTGFEQFKRIMCDSSYREERRNTPSNANLEFRSSSHRGKTLFIVNPEMLALAYLDWLFVEVEKREEWLRYPTASTPIAGLKALVSAYANLDCASKVAGGYNWNGNMQRDIAASYLLDPVNW